MPTFKYISSTSTARLRRETSQFAVLRWTWTYDDEFSFLFLNLNKILKNSNPGKVACFWYIERVQIEGIKFERTQIHFFYRRFHCHCRRPCLSSLSYIRLTNLSPMVHSFYPLPPPPRLSLSLSPSVLRFKGYSKLLKATRKGKKSKQGFDVTPGNLHGNLPHSSEGRAPTCCDEGSNSYYSLILYWRDAKKLFTYN